MHGDPAHDHTPLHDQTDAVKGTVMTAVIGKINLKNCSL
jgi:hypothetical protein